MGLLYLRKGIYDVAEEHLKTAIDRITQNHTKPRDGEAYYYWVYAKDYRGRKQKAYKNLLPSNMEFCVSFSSIFSIAQMDCKRGHYDVALDHLNRSLSTNANNIKARNLKSAVLRMLDNPALALEVSSETMVIDRLDLDHGLNATWPMSRLLRSRNLKKN